MHDGVTYYPGSSKEAYEKRKSGQYLKNDYAWRWSKELYEFGLANGWIVFQNGRIYTKGYLKAFIDKTANGYSIAFRTKERKISTIDFVSNEYSNDIAKKQVANYDLGAKFDYPKATNLISKLMSTYYDKDCIVVDFFSGSGTSADAVMQLNAQDGGNRKFILVQLPETLEESNNNDGKYLTICDISKERIRRAGKKIKEESPLTTQHLDTGFRVLKLADSNMKQVYYTPTDTKLQMERTLFDTASNIKEGRSDLDLLFQVMLEKDVTLDAPIRKEVIQGHDVYFVDDTYLVAAFGEKLPEELIKELAKMQPFNFVMANRGLADDSMADNFEQIFKAYSPDTNCMIL